MFRYILVLVALLSADIAFACPTCKEALESSSGGNLQAGFQYSILFMMSVPFILFGSLSGLFYWQVRRAAAVAEADSRDNVAPE
jgi:uncharacterized membrane protein